MPALQGQTRVSETVATLEKELKQRLDFHQAAIVIILQRVMDIIDRRPSHLGRRRKRSAFIPSLCAPPRHLTSVFRPLISVP